MTAPSYPYTNAPVSTLDTTDFCFLFPSPLTEGEVVRNTTIPTLNLNPNPIPTTITTATKPHPHPQYEPNDLAVVCMDFTGVNL